jgi:hypothetical protein
MRCLSHGRGLHLKRRIPKELSIQSPTEGVTYKLDSTYLSNEREGEPHPVPFELYCFIQRMTAKRSTHFVHTFEGPTEMEAIDQLEEFASRSDVELVEEQTRKHVPKEWLTTNNFDVR